MKRIAGEAGGLFAALMIAVSPPLIERGNLGWFKSEPLAYSSSPSPPTSS